MDSRSLNLLSPSPMNSNEQKAPNTQCPCFEAFPALLILDAEPETKRFRELVVLNEDKTLSVRREAIISHPSGKKELIRETDKEKYRDILELCDAYHIEADLLLSFN